MTICKYCFNKGMNKNEYENFTNNIKSTAAAIKQPLIYNNGIYYNTSDLFHWSSDNDIKQFIINELKLLGLEFFQDQQLYRVTN